MGVRKKSFNDVEWRRLRAWLRGKTYVEVMKEAALPLTLARVAAASQTATYLDPQLVEDVLQTLPDHPSKVPPKQEPQPKPNATQTFTYNEFERFIWGVLRECVGDPGQRRIIELRAMEKFAGL